jgi:purine nucleosidase
MSPARGTPEGPAPRPRKLILDVDTGVDDAIALCLACRWPGSSVELVTTVAGNTDVERATANTLLVLDRLGMAQAPPVARGAEAPLARELFCAPEIHGDDGLGGVRERLPAPSGSPLPTPAWDALSEAVAAAPGELTLVATGPLTNVARAIQADPAALDRLQSLVVMGGAVEERGNVTDHAEFNIYVDPEAAGAVFASGLPLTMVSLDVTHQVVLGRAELRRWKQQGGPSEGLLAFLEQVTDQTMAVHKLRCGFDGLYLHDPLAVAVALDPSLVETRRARLEVDTTDAERGRVRALWDEAAPSTVAMAVEAERFVGLLERALTGR